MGVWEMGWMEKGRKERKKMDTRDKLARLGTGWRLPVESSSSLDVSKMMNGDTPTDKVACFSQYLFQWHNQLVTLVSGYT